MQVGLVNSIVAARFVSSGGGGGPDLPPGDAYYVLDPNEIAGADGSTIGSGDFSQLGTSETETFTKTGGNILLQTLELDNQNVIEFVSANAAHLSINDGSHLPSPGNFCVALVYKQTAHDGNDLGIFTIKPSSGSHAYNEDSGLVLETGTAEDRLNVLGGAGSGFSMTDIVLNNGWNSLVLNVSNGSGELYINGALASSTSYGSFGAGEGSLLIGAYWLDAMVKNFMSGQLAHLAYYAIELDATPLSNLLTYHANRFPSIPF